MIQFNKLIIHNFGSYGHAEFDLRQKGFCLVTGKNNCKKDNALSNGSGKSFIWNALCYALTGETLNGLTKNLKNINSEESISFVSTEVYIKNDHFIITRYIAPHSDLKIIKNQVDVSGKGIQESRKKLEELLPDLTKDLVSSIFILGQGLPNKFSSFTPAGRKDLLEKLTKSDYMIEDIKTRVGTRNQELSNQLRIIEDTILVQNTQLNLISNEISNLQEELASKYSINNYENKIRETEENIKQLDLQLKGYEANIEILNKTIEDLNTQLIQKTSEKATVSASEFEAYNLSYSKLLESKSSLQSQLTIETTNLKRLQAITDVCPTCGQKLIGVTKPDTTDLELKIKQITDELNIQNSAILECQTKHQKYLKEISDTFDSQIKDIEKNIFEYKNNFQSIFNAKTNIQQQITTASENLARFKFENENFNNAVNNIKNNISSKQKLLDEIRLKITSAEKNKLDISTRLAIIKKMETLVKRDFRGYLLTNIIQYLDHKVKDYSEIVFGNRDLSISINGNSLDIIYCNKLIELLSGGERQRVDLILQFAIRNLLSAYLNITSNILVLDEITDFLDKQSCSAVMKLLEHELQTVESVFIVSHHAQGLDLPIDSELQIIKNEDGISEILK